MKDTVFFISVSFFSLLLLSFFGCEKSEPEATLVESVDQDTINYVTVPQYDIIWNSLASTAWPKALHDAQCTGRSSFAGPSQGKVRNTIPLSEYTTDPVMGTDSIFYIVSDSNLYAISLNGTRLWNRYIGKAKGSSNDNVPIITSEGDIIVSAQRGISAFRNDGTLQWHADLSESVVLKSSAVDLNGNIYTIGYNGTLYAISKSGSLLWQLSAPSGFFEWRAQSTISFAPDGSKFYVGGSTENQSLYEIGTNGEILRIDSLGGHQNGAISIDIDGNIFTYFGEALVSISPTGEVRWRINNVGSNYNVTIDPYGNIAYLSYGRLFLVDNNGNKRWDIPVNQDDYITHLVCDVNGTIFIETSNDMLHYDVQAVSNNGEILWTLTVLAYVKIAGPSLTQNGYLLFPHSNYYPTPKQMYIIE